MRQAVEKPHVGCHGSGDATPDRLRSVVTPVTTNVAVRSVRTREARRRRARKPDATETVRLHGSGNATRATPSGWRGGRASRHPDREGGRWESGAIRTREAYQRRARRADHRRARRPDATKVRGSRTPSGWRGGRASRHPDREGGRWESGAIRTREADQRRARRPDHRRARRPDATFVATGVTTLRRAVTAAVVLRFRGRGASCGRPEPGGGPPLPDCTTPIRSHHPW